MMFDIDLNRHRFIREAERLYENGDVDKAIELIESNDDGDLPGIGKLVYARCLIKAGDRDSAKRLLLDIIAGEPDFPSALEMLAAIGGVDQSEYYRKRLDEKLKFVEETGSFITAERIEEESEEKIRRNALIGRIKGMLGSDAERIWPFETRTLAELFIKQGHIRKGLAVYSRLLQNKELGRDHVLRVTELLESETARLSKTAESGAGVGETGSDEKE
jgi:hypothetical protein